LKDVKLVELIVFCSLFGAVTVMGFVASRWRPGRTLRDLDEWGLGGRRFGSWVTWFLIGGDIYTAYTFVAVPALVFGAGAMGFFAVPYTIVIYPLVLLPLIRLWSVSRVHGYVTPADFVRGRYGSPTLALLIAVTGILATALIAFVKDILIYLVIVVAILYLPIKLDGWPAIFSAAEAKFNATPSATDGLLLNANNQLQYATLALGSALALFLYPHSVTGVLAAGNRNVIKRNMSALPAYSVLLGLLALMGFAAIGAGVEPIVNEATGRQDPNTIIPVLFEQQFPDWFAGLAFAAIGIGALVPAAIMSIAAANLWTRNVYKEYLHRSATPAQEASQAKAASLVVKFGAVAFIVGVDPQYAIDLQLIGGVIILQTLPAVAIALYTRWFHLHGLVAGWLLGMAAGFWMLYQIPNPATRRTHFGAVGFPVSDLGAFGWYPFAGANLQIYVGVVALAVNLAVALVVTVVVRTLRVPNGTDGTDRGDYLADGVPEPGEVPVTPLVAR
jgi:SSS family solute:Na+ symporter